MKTGTLAAAVVLAATFAVAPSGAQEAAAIEAPAGEGGYLHAAEATPASLSVLDVAGKLVIVLVIAWGAVRAIRWWHDGRLGSSHDGGGGSRRMWLEETLRLGADARLYLVEVEGRRLLLSARDGDVVEVADLSDVAPDPATYRSVRRRADGSTDELNVAQSSTSTQAVRPDVVESDESWEQRRGRLLRELQEQG